MSRQTVFTIRTEDGETYIGEYIGAKEGWLFLLTDDGEVTRIEQRRIGFLASGRVNFDV